MLAHHLEMLLNTCWQKPPKHPAHHYYCYQRAHCQRQTNPYRLLLQHHYQNHHHQYRCRYRLEYRRHRDPGFGHYHKPYLSQPALTHRENNVPWQKHLSEYAEQTPHHATKKIPKRGRYAMNRKNQMP